MSVKTKSPDQVAEERILAQLRQLGDRRVQRDAIIFEGDQLKAPEAYKGDLGRLIKFIQSYQAAQEEVHGFERTFRYRPWDGAHAFHQVLKKLGQAALGKAQYSFFGKIPPQYVTINVGPNTTTQVPWGELSLPLVKGSAYTGSTQHPEYGMLFELMIEAPKAFQQEIEALFVLIEKELEENSIYKGKAIDGQQMAEFLDLSGVDEKKVIYTQDATRQFEANIWSLIRHSATMRNLGVPLKRATLLEGPYGTGKTLGAFLTAKVAQDNEWTFVYCRPGKDNIYETIATARLYQPSVVFFEDVDSVSEESQESRDKVSKLLDVFDGIQAKGTELMVVMTTNHKENILKGMVRPGRLDAVIHIGYMDTPGVEQMIKVNVEDTLLHSEIDYERVAGSYEGFPPSFVREAVDRAVRYGLAEALDQNGKFNQNQPMSIADFGLKLTTEDFVLAGDSLRPQLEMMEQADERKQPPALEDSLGHLVKQTLNDALVLRGGKQWGELSVQD